VGSGGKAPEAGEKITPEMLRKFNFGIDHLEIFGGISEFFGGGGGIFPQRGLE